jgi:hypothetical protein
MKKYKANEYDMLVFNCNHFSSEFLHHLTGRALPARLNRAARLGAYLQCLIPQRFLEVTPPDATPEQIQAASRAKGGIRRRGLWVEAGWRIGQVIVRVLRKVLRQDRQWDVVGGGAKTD